MQKEISKMSINAKPLAIDQQILTWLCVLPANENTSKLKKWLKIALVLALIAADLTVFASSFMYAVKFVSIDFQGFSVALYAVIAAFPMANSIALAFLHRHKVPPIFGSLFGFYDKFKTDGDSIDFLVDANNTSQWLWKMYFKFFMCGYLVIISVPSVASIVICFYRNGHFDVMQTFRPFKFLLPWDQTTFAGYIGEIIYSILISQAYMMYNGAVLLPFISICLYHQAFYKVFRHLVRKLCHQPNGKYDHQLICEIVEFHTSIKNWFSESAKLYDPHLMVQLICNMLMLVTPVFQLDQLILKQFDFKIFCFTLLCISISLSNLFLCCFLGKLASESYRKMADSLYVCNWYELPLDLQKYFILMIANAQLPLHYRGYGLITLHLEAFTKLMRAVYTCYMMFKTLTSN